MFRLADLQLGEIAMCALASAVEQALNNLPNDLNIYYIRSLSQVPSSHQRGVFQLLQLMTYSDSIITVDEALDFMVIDPCCANLEDAFQSRNVMKDFDSISLPRISRDRQSF
ncbi:uncharacterized protein IWZ02DRAFT_85179 [Phyllosticta citriasiana]|uniref:uncharacterized protein n=1 Tax=Phyllosticta citriasiana TaxID=595635 RepID=UPI0030FDE801